MTNYTESSFLMYGQGHKIWRITGTLLLLREFIFFIAFYILGSSINWPQSLDLPALEALRLIHSHPNSVFTGYLIYLVASLLFLPIAIALRALLKNNNPSQQLLLDAAVGLSIISVVFRSLGIVRWLFAMPVLAALAADPSSSSVVLDTVALSYDVLDGYAGKIGEFLGVQLSGALFLGVFAAAMFQNSRIPKLFPLWLFVAAVLFLPLGSALDIEDSIYLTINGTTFSLWAMVFGGYLTFNNRRGQGGDVVN